MNKNILVSVLIFSIPLLLFGQNNGTFKDSRDGHVYKWVKIGQQTWMAENLSYLPNVSPPIKGVKNEERLSPFCFVYDYFGSSEQEAKKTINFKTYGVLYNYIMATKVCPNGWHLPTDEEFIILEKEIGMDIIDLNEPNYRMTGNVGYLLKSKIKWENGGNGTDKFGFSVLPGGFRHDGDLSKPNPQGGFGLLGTDAFFWTSTIRDNDRSIRRDFTSTSKGISRFTHSKSQGYSVRCIKD
jgi:uncharacterized protein (TIGR02145 family)